MGQKWFEKAESKWGRWWSDVLDVFKSTFKLISSYPLLFILFCLIHWALIKAWHMFPYQTLSESQLMLYSTINWIVVSLLRLATTLVAWNVAASVLRGASIKFPRNFLIVFRHTCLFIVSWIIFYQFVWAPVFVKLANPLFELSKELNHHGWLNTLVFLSTGYLGELPFIVLIGMFGFTLVARGAGDSISIKQSLTIARVSPAPLVIILLIWMVGESAVSQIAMAVFTYSSHYPSWLTKGVHMVYAPFFLIVASVLYERHRQISLSSVNYGQCQD